MLVYCFTLGTYSSDRVMAANRASFPRYAGEQPQGLRRVGMGVSLQIARRRWHRPPSPLPPRFSLPPWPGEGAD